MIDAKAFGEELAGIVKGQLAPILSRIEALEKRLDGLPAPRDGKDADLGEVRQIIANEVQGIKTALEDIKAPDLPDIPAIVAEEVEKAISALPSPQDGKSVTVEEVVPLIVSEVGKRVSELPKPKDGEPGKDGASVDRAEVERMVAESVGKVVSAIPAPKDGADGKDGKDGVGLAGAIIDRSGELVVTLTNGETRNLGPVIGKDGQPGKDGADGFGFDDLEASYGGNKTVMLKFTKGARVKEFAFTLPIVIDRGIFSEGKSYTAGDGVTWGGSFWIAQKDTGSRPGDGGDWRLSVKKGRDGRDGVMKEAKANEPVRVGVPGKAV
jgi:hypothetical protein